MNFTKRCGWIPTARELMTIWGWPSLTSGKPQESIPEFEAALRLKPEFKAAADGLRRAQAQLK